jgi:hypothetical protein
MNIKRQFNDVRNPQIARGFSHPVRFFADAGRQQYDSAAARGKTTFSGPGDGETQAAANVNRRGRLSPFLFAMGAACDLRFHPAPLLR